MELSEYVTRRMLMDSCDVSTRINVEHECVYSILALWLDKYTEDYGGIIIPKLYTNTSNKDELIRHAALIYDGILSSDKARDTVNILRSLFFATYYLMRLYKDNVCFASQIALCFEAITCSFDSWKHLKNEYDTGI